MDSFYYSNSKIVRYSELHRNLVTFVGFITKLNIYQVIIFAKGISCSEAVRFVGRSPGCINFATLIRWFMAAIFTFVFGVWVESTRNLEMLK